MKRKDVLVIGFAYSGHSDIMPDDDYRIYVKRVVSVTTGMEGQRSKLKIAVPVREQEMPPDPDKEDPHMPRMISLLYHLNRSEDWNYNFSNEQITKVYKLFLKSFKDTLGMIKKLDCLVLLDQGREANQMYELFKENNQSGVLTQSFPDIHKKRDKSIHDYLCLPDSIEIVKRT